MKAAIRQRAPELGFDDCRFTPPPHRQARNNFRTGSRKNHHGEMAWLERNAEKRAEPQKVLAGAKSVICLAVSYEIVGVPM